MKSPDQIKSSRRALMREVAKQLREARKTGAEVAEEVRRLEAASAALAGGGRRTRTRVARTPLDESRRIAGKAAIEEVAKALKAVGRTTQAEITKATKKNSGTVTHSLRVLEASGVAEKTHRRHHGSEEWSWTGGTGKVHDILEAKVKRAQRAA